MICGPLEWNSLEASAASRFWTSLDTQMRVQNLILAFLMSFGQPLSQPDTQFSYKAWLSHAKLSQCKCPTFIPISSFYLALVVAWCTFLHISVPHTPSCFHFEHWLDFFACDLATLAIAWASMKCLPTVFHSQLDNVCTTMHSVKTI